MKLPTPWRAFTIVTAAALMFTACSSETPETTDDASPEAQDELRIGAVPGWSDHTGIAYIYEHVLEENGYEVEVASTVDVGPAYAAVAEGDLDLYGAAWPERAQASYWEEHQDRDRKSIRLNSSHVAISYAVFCLKKKKTRSRTYHRCGSA